MLSNALLDPLAAAHPELVKATNLFAEELGADQAVMVKASPYPYSASSDLPVRRAKVQVIVKGWTYAAGYALAEAISRTLEGLSGDLAIAGESYSIYNLVPLDYPRSYKADGAVHYTQNFEAYYRVTFA